MTKFDTLKVLDSQLLGFYISSQLAAPNAFENHIDVGNAKSKLKIHLRNTLKLFRARIPSGSGPFGTLSLLRSGLQIGLVS